MNWTRNLACLLLALMMALGLALSAVAEAKPSETAQLTEADIQAMNDAGATFVRDADDRLTTLIGNFYNETVKDYSDAAKALSGVRTLLGIDQGTDVLNNYRIVDDLGNTCYTFRQVYESLTIPNAVVKVLVDKNGKTIALTSSLIPGKAKSNEEPSITKEQAVDIVKQTLDAPPAKDVIGRDISIKSASETNYSYYPDATQLIMTEIEPKTYLSQVYVVYTNNPIAETFDKHTMPYLAHYVGASGDYAGKYLSNVPASSFQVETTNWNDTASVFEGKSETTYTGTVTLHDGTKQEVKVPVLYDEANGLYYLADTVRKIAVTDYSAFMKSFSPDITSSKDNTGWEDHAMIAYANYIKIYDVFADYGLKSVDGLGTPILIMTDYRDAWGQPVENAAYMGNILGWHTIATSTVGGYEECVDVLAHEYTHGVTAALMGGSDYQNATGAINESYSDIMGNISELLTNSTKDTTWLIAENRGNAIRSMSDPNLFQQPGYVGDAFYAASTSEPDINYNDRGGVHFNSSFLNYAAYKLNEAGMPLDGQRNVWLETIVCLTPHSGFRDVYALLKSATKNYSLDQYQSVIDETFAQLGVLGDINQQALTATKEGNGRIQFKVNVDAEKYPTVYVTVHGITPGEPRLGWTWPDSDRVVTTLLPEGSYYIYARAINQATGDTLTLVYSPTGWSSHGSIVKVASGDVMDLGTCEIQ